jgi:hypothetical protein
MARSVRVFYRGVQGRAAQNVNIGGFDITRKSAISITAAAAPLGGGFFDPDIRLNVHSPDVFVTNVVPHDPEGGPDGGVEFMLHVNSDSPMDVAVTITVMEPFEFPIGPI